MGMLDRAAVGSLAPALLARAGEYLHSPLREDRVTCAVCAAPVSGYERCLECDRHLAYEPLADAVAFLTYAVAGQQSGQVMRGYKAPQPVHEHLMIVIMLVLLGLSAHKQCPGTLAGAPVTHWATVPSLPARQGPHPLRSIISRVGLGAEVRLEPAASVAHPRDINPEHYRAVQRLPRGSHVLLLDDTWAGGGHAQSAALALRQANAGRVSVLAVARWLKRDFGGHPEFAARLTSRAYDPAICPWTGGNCPR